MQEKTAHTDGKRAYTAPRLTQLGTLHELTLQSNKDFGGSDGFTFQGQPVTFTSP
jgi:hypothetical protein